MPAPLAGGRNRESGLQQMARAGSRLGRISRFTFNPPHSNDSFESSLLARGCGFLSLYLSLATGLGPV